ncbi:uroporphyrinogen decarboxylase family protein [Thermoanaerobacterium sp. DL9XJH110]|uniref:uroporphyrinogen decarboxylase family protein n=1 Tax=Thermoanaerobacterium sp. DL9XJH110 TaxID=3386643 RepID=UPI003BB68362
MKKPEPAKKERVYAALQGKNRGRPPCGEIAFPPEFAGYYHSNSILTGDSNKNDISPRDLSILECILSDLRADIAVISLEPYMAASAVTAGSAAEVKHFIYNTDYFVLGGVPGIFYPAIEELGFEEAARMAKKQPEEFRLNLKKLRERHEKLAADLLSQGTHGIIIFDDLAGSHGPLFSPVMLRQLVFPELEELISKIRIKAKPVFFHSDGNITGILHDIMDMGVDVIHGFEGMTLKNIRAVKKILGNRATFMGNIPVNFKPDEADKIYTTVREMKKIFTDGRYIFSSDGGTMPASLDNLRMVYRYFHKLWEGINEQSHNNHTS